MSVSFFNKFYSLSLKLSRLLALYLLSAILLSIIPLGATGTTLTDTTVIHLRFDYLLHIAAFAPMVPLWSLARPHYPLWLVIVIGLLLGMSLEGSHYLLAYRGFNINDLFSNIVGVLLGGGLLFWKRRKVA